MAPRGVFMLRVGVFFCSFVRLAVVVDICPHIESYAPFHGGLKKLM